MKSWTIAWHRFVTSHLVVWSNRLISFNSGFAITQCRQGLLVKDLSSFKVLYWCCDVKAKETILYLTEFLPLDNTIKMWRSGMASVKFYFLKIAFCFYFLASGQSILELQNLRDLCCTITCWSWSITCWQSPADRDHLLIVISAAQSRSQSTVTRTKRACTACSWIIVLFTQRFC